MRRLRQCVAAIREDKHYTSWERRQWLMWQTRTVCSYVAATVPVDRPGQVNQLLEAAQQIGVEDDEEPTETAERKPPKGEPKVGSYEAFLSTFGAPAKWAGR